MNSKQNAKLLFKPGPCEVAVFAWHELLWRHADADADDDDDADADAIDFIAMDTKYIRWIIIRRLFVYNIVFSECHCRPAFEADANSPERWSVDLRSVAKDQPTKRQGWGGWNDARDHNLCKSMLSSANDGEAARAQFKWLADLSSAHDAVRQ